MESCAGATGIPKTVLQVAKRAGCPAFVGCRVALADLLKWGPLWSNDGEANMDWRRQGEKWRSLRAEVEYNEEVGRLVPKTDVIETSRASAARARAILDSHLLVELPAKLDGRGAEEIALAIDGALTQAYQEISGGVPSAKRNGERTHETK